MRKKKVNFTKFSTSIVSILTFVSLPFFAASINWSLSQSSILTNIWIWILCVSSHNQKSRCRIHPPETCAEWNFILSSARVAEIHF